MTRARLLAALALLATPALGAPAAPPSDTPPAWVPIEREAPYTITGASAPELYASIGENGPKASLGRAIALTTFTLTWTRDYQTQGTACVLASAKPKLTITHHLPKPRTPPRGALAPRWATFLAGVRAHERQHGVLVTAMTRAIETATVGLSVPDDPGCRKIRAVMTKTLAALSARQQAESRAFDRRELSDGGAVHQLVLNFVNGP